jgi:ribosome-associated toxin RatA of RatAB toxin-antitoxin module
MPTVRKSVIVARPASAMFALVEDCERYPEFLPWCADACVHERTALHTRATLEIDYHGLKSHVTTINHLSPPERIELEFVEGPFETFRGRWRFVPLADDGCRVEFELDYAFSTKTMEVLVGPMFGHIIDTLVDRFVQRAESMP